VVAKEGDVCVEGVEVIKEVPELGEAKEEMMGGSWRYLGGDYPDEDQQVLVPSLSVAFLMTLGEFVVYRDNGHTLQVSVHGLARMPVTNSRRGNIVHFYTAWNGRVTLVSNDLSSDESAEAASPTQVSLRPLRHKRKAADVR